MKKRIRLLISLLVICMTLCVCSSEIKTNATTTYTVVLSPVGGDYSSYSISYSGNLISSSSNNNVLEFASGTEATITLTAKEGYIIVPEQNCNHGGDAIASSGYDYENSDVNWDSVSYGTGYTGISGFFTDSWHTYIITITDNHDLATLNFIFEPLQRDIQNEAQGGGSASEEPATQEPTTEESTTEEPATEEQPDNTSDITSEEAGKDTVAQYEPDDTSNSHWTKVVNKIKEFQKIIEIITNFIFGIGTLTAILCLAISIFSLTTSGSHPKERRKAIENLTVSLICIAFLGSTKLISILLLQIVL